MTSSQNGWPINPIARTTLYVAGVEFGGVRSGDVFTVLSYVATRFHNEVEHLVPGQCGAYNPRKIAGSNTWSNHASATAIDCNWRKHPLGMRATFTAAQRSAILDIEGDCAGVVRWGGHFTHTDEMHFEINKGPASVAVLADRIREDIVTPADRKLIIDGVVAALKPQLDAAASAWDDETGRVNRVQMGTVLVETRDNTRTILDKLPPAQVRPT